MVRWTIEPTFAGWSGGGEARAGGGLDGAGADVLAAVLAHHVGLDAPAAPAVQREPWRPFGRGVVAVAPLEELVERGGGVGALGGGGGASRRPLAVTNKPPPRFSSTSSATRGSSRCASTLRAIPSERWKSVKRETPRNASRTISRLQRSPITSSERAMEQTCAGYVRSSIHSLLHEATRIG